MSTAEHVDGAVPWNVLSACEDDLDQFSVALAFHQWDDTTDGVDGKFVRTHTLGTLLSQFREDPALNRTIEHGSACSIYGCSRTRNCLANRLFYLFFTHVRCSEYIEHGGDIDTDLPLEVDNLFDADLDIPIDIVLEGA